MSNKEPLPKNEDNAQAINPSQTVPQRLVDVRGLAEILKVPVSWIYERTRLGKIPCIRVGKYLRFYPAEVLSFLRARGTDGNNGKDGVS